MKECSWKKGLIKLLSWPLSPYLWSIPLCLILNSSDISFFHQKEVMISWRYFFIILLPFANRIIKNERGLIRVRKRTDGPRPAIRIRFKLSLQAWTHTKSLKFLSHWSYYFVQLLWLDDDDDLNDNICSQLLGPIFTTFTHLDIRAGPSLLAHQRLRFDLSSWWRNGVTTHDVRTN